MVSYIITRWGLIDCDDPNHKPYALFASTGASLNHLDWNTTNTSQSPFGSLSTFNINMNKYNKSALVWNQYIQSNINNQYLQNMFIAQMALKHNCLFKTQLQDNLCINKKKPRFGTINHCNGFLMSCDVEWYVML